MSKREEQPMHSAQRQKEGAADGTAGGEKEMEEDGEGKETGGGSSKSAVPLVTTAATAHLGS